MEQEEYIVDEHKVTHRVHLGDKEIFLAVQQDVKMCIRDRVINARRVDRSGLSSPNATTTTNTSPFIGINACVPSG